jgi:hypothetical protein
MSDTTTTHHLEMVQPHTNGHDAPAGDASSNPPARLPTHTGPRIPRRDAWVEVPDPYEGFRVKLWVNYPRRFLEDIQSGESARIKDALCKIVLEHNGWCDEEGAPLPPASTPDFWDAIPDELAGALIALLNEEGQRLPNAIAQRTKRR